MRRPAWAAAPGLSAAWSGSEALWRQPNHPEGERLATEVLKALQTTRPIVFSREQVESLPVTGDWGPEYFREMRLPFDSVFLDTGGSKSYDGRPITGGLALQQSELQSLPCIIPFEHHHGMTFPLGTVHPARDQDQYRVEMAAGLKDERRTTYGESCIDAAALLIACFYLLESANVDLAEVQLSAKRRGRELEKGRQIALTVRVKPPKTKSVSRNGHSNYSHRFEVAGHYMHFPEGTQLGDSDPTKLSFVPGRGFVRKIWCPPHVKGPIDKPLVPKVRVVEA